jgi:membrane protease YdiL (CAAX protease family)
LPGFAPACIAIFVSAGCFALAHVVVQGQITAALTFVPGVILAWLFLRTGSLLAPILFHGVANVSYAVIALTLTRP